MEAVMAKSRLQPEDENGSIAFQQWPPGMAAKVGMRTGMKAAEGCRLCRGLSLVL